MMKTNKTYYCDKKSYKRIIRIGILMYFVENIANSEDW